MWAETARDIEVIWVRREGENFYKGDWTTQIRLNLFNKIARLIRPSLSSGAHSRDPLADPPYGMFI